MDFGALPPEINSALMYTGAGATPLLSAGAAWNCLSSELSAASSSIEAVIARLSSELWLGSASLSMVAAAQPLLAWLDYTAESSGIAAAQAMASAAAFEAAHAMTVPPAVVAENRARLTTLIADNVLGRNLQAIAANEARYSQMWEQDAAAMYGYAASSSAAGRLDPLTGPPQVADPAGAAGQDAAAHAGMNALISDGPDAVLSLASPGEAEGAAHDIMEILAEVDELDHPGFELVNHLKAIYADIGVSATTMFTPSGDDDAGEVAVGAASALGLANPVSTARIGGARLLAGRGNASTVGHLSVPASWSNAEPLATVSPALDGTYWAVPVAEADDSTDVMPPAPGMVARAGGAGAGPRYGVKPIVMPKHRLF